MMETTLTVNGAVIPVFSKRMTAAIAAAESLIPIAIPINLVKSRTALAMLVTRATTTLAKL